MPILHVMGDTKRDILKISHCRYGGNLKNEKKHEKTGESKEKSGVLPENRDNRRKKRGNHAQKGRLPRFREPADRFSERFRK